MDRFSKTTEIDTAEITAATMEDDTPKKSKASNIIALIICILISVIIWMLVMENDTEILERELDDIAVYETVDGESVFKKNTEITLTGVRKDIIEFKASDLKIEKTDGVYKVVLSDEMSGYSINYSEITEQTLKGGITVSVNAE